MYDQEEEGDEDDEDDDEGDDEEDDDRTANKKVHFRQRIRSTQGAQGSVSRDEEDVALRHTYADKITPLHKEPRNIVEVNSAPALAPAPVPVPLRREAEPDIASTTGPGNNLNLSKEERMALEVCN